MKILCWILSALAAALTQKLTYMLVADWGLNWIIAFSGGAALVWSDLIDAPLRRWARERT